MEEGLYDKKSYTLLHKTLIIVTPKEIQGKLLIIIEIYVIVILSNNFILFTYNNIAIK